MRFGPIRATGMREDIKEIVWAATRNLIFSQLIEKSNIPMNDREMAQKIDEAERLTSHLMKWKPGGHRKSQD